jgi:Ni/Co efflux regulator RcnB
MMMRNLGKIPHRLGLLAAIAAFGLSAATADAAPRRDGARQDRRAERNWSNERPQARPDRYRDAPPANARPRGGPDVRPDVRRGAFLPDDRRGAPVGDYNGARLRAPPQGYGWYRENGRYMLLDQYTGQVLDVVE